MQSVTAKDVAVKTDSVPDISRGESLDTLSLFPLKMQDFFLIALLCLLLYLPSVSAPWISDDIRFITSNPAIKNLSHIGEFFLHPAEATASTSGYEGIYRPLRTLSFAIDYAIWGAKPLGFHLTNIFFHMAAAILVFLVCRQLSLRRNSALAGGLVFAAHPAQVEAITWISSRADAMAAVFVLTSFLLFVSARMRRRTGWRLPAAWIAFILSLMSKETAMVLPALLLAYDIFLQRKHRIGRRALLAQHAVFFGTAGAYFLIRTAILGQIAQQGYWGGSIVITMLTMARCFFVYLQLVFLPTARNCMEYLVPLTKEPITFAAVLPFLGVVLVVAGVVFVVFAAPLIGFGLVWFLIALAPVSNIFPISMLMAERFLYLPLAGMCIACAGVVQSLTGRGTFWRRLTHGGAVAALIAFSFITVAKNTAWRDPEVLWSQTLERYPDSYRARMGLAEVYYERGQTVEAIKQYGYALRIFPNTQVLHDMGNAYRQVGDFPSAVAAYKSALALEPDSSWTHTSLGITYLLQGKVDQAIGELRRAIELERSYWIAHYYLGVALEGRGELKEALRELNEALAYAPEREDVRARIDEVEGKLLKKKGGTNEK